MKVAWTGFTCDALLRKSHQRRKIGFVEDATPHNYFHLPLTFYITHAYVIVNMHIFVFIHVVDYSNIRIASLK